jgi:hypothetical protein
MTHTEFIEKEYNRFFENIQYHDYTNNKQIVTFMNWCFDNNLLDNLTEKDLYNFYGESDFLNLPLLKNHSITVVIEMWLNSCKIGVSPTEDFTDMKNCSVLIFLPCTEEEEQEFYKTINQMIKEK